MGSIGIGCGIRVDGKVTGGHSKTGHSGSRNLKIQEEHIQQIISTYTLQYNTVHM